MSDILKTDIKYITGVGPQKKDILKREIGIETYATCWNTIHINMWIEVIYIP